MNNKVFVSGCYDMLHSGHVAFFKEASNYGDLYVGIGSDKTIEELKHRKPVYSEKERLYMVKAIRYVKDASINNGSGMLDFVDTLDEIKPDIFVVNSDGDSELKRELCKQRGIKYVVLQRTPEPGLDARSTTALRSTDTCRLPYRVDLAGTWIDQPYVSRLAPGWAITVSIEPTRTFMQRAGMATSTRNAARKIWPYELPNYNEEMMARLLFCFENDPENEGHISGAQDSIGICMSGLTRHYYNSTYWPEKIETCHDEKVLSWLEQHIALVEMFPRPDGYSVVKDKNINTADVTALTDAAKRCWDAIMQQNLDAFAKAFNDSFQAQIRLFPNMLNKEVEKFINEWKDKSMALKLTGAGGGGYLAIVFDGECPAGAIPITIRR